MCDTRHTVKRKHQQCYFIVSDPVTTGMGDHPWIAKTNSVCNE